MASPASRMRLTIEQKRALLEYRMANPHVKGIDLRRWARTTFNLSRDPAKSTMSAWLHSDVNVEGIHPKHKSKQQPQTPKLERKLIQWIQKCEKWCVPIVSGPTIRVKAMQIRDQMLASDDHDDPNKLLSLTFSNGWLHRFQMRHNLKSRRVYGEAASANAETIDDGKMKLRSITAGYEKKDIFNLDETAYFYCSNQSKTICTKGIPGRKKVKKRITVAVTSNADGSSKWPLLFIGTAKQPRCFGQSTADDLGVDYTASRKGWMTRDVFGHWIEDFDATMRLQNRHVLLLLDNASPHRYDGHLSNVTVHMLPPNTTAFLQPQDAGIIQAFKARIGVLRSTFLVERFDKLVESVDESDKENFGSLVNKLHEVTLLQALEWAKEAWHGVTQQTIVNCWRHTGILDEEVYELIDSMRNL
ncbi:Aste57867_6581 [Aphanomyces stellatus]|uniref:Aste57867_1188 protein n=1 Tax=Aphanomyces stellatus TaxID=120398 RepID=A0A485K5N0_9STRA|nr:hypothetical protein As57867_006564 [Aphanomyces stellatus]KAF0709853.1 hypothetical protein As57867_005717 [Aphanomyces stellatus]KAF0719233.1 hypothetical protein As57867_001187 [Aphanomyces stellatus]VFT78408.1 Aste57867_1188 [Aphanomyces stellatus]VFT82761.1 Aste57867_5730 [Aphanomyces stellatus]